MAVITKTIGSSGRDYSTLAAWEAANGGSATANLVSDGNSIVGQCFNDSEFSSASNLLTITGLTTDATHTITLTTGTGQSFRDNANAQTNALRYNASNGVGINYTGQYDFAVSVTSNNVTLSKLQVTASSGLQESSALFANGVTTIVDGCIFEGYTPAFNVNHHAIVDFENTGSVIRNCVVINRYPSTSGAALFIQFNASAVNVTVVTPSDVAQNGATGIRIQYGGCTLENCAVFGFTTCTFGGTAPTITTCMTDVASPPSGFTGGKTYANQFQNTLDATRDFRLKTGADLIDAGTTDSTNAANDIVGTARPQGSSYDIGAWEFVSGVIVQSLAPLLQPIMPVLQRREMATGGRGVGPFIGAGPSVPIPPPPAPPPLIPGVQLQPIMPQLQWRELASGRGIGPFIGAGPINPLPLPPDLPPSIPGTKVTPILTVLQRKELASGRGIGPFIGAAPPVGLPNTLFSILFDMLFPMSHGAGEKADWLTSVAHAANEQATDTIYLDHRANAQSTPTLQAEHRAGEQFTPPIVIAHSAGEQSSPTILTSHGANEQSSPRVQVEHRGGEQSTLPSVIAHGAGEQSSEAVLASHTANEQGDRGVVLAHGANEQRDFTTPLAHGGSEQSSPATLGGHLAGEQSSPTMPVAHGASVRVSDTVQVEHRAGEQSDQKDPIAYAGAANTNLSDTLLPIAHRATSLRNESIIGGHRAGEQTDAVLAIPRVSALQATETAPIAHRIGLISTVVAAIARGVRVVADRILALAYLGVRRPDPEFTVLLNPSRYSASIGPSAYTAVLKLSRYTVSVD